MRFLSVCVSQVIDDPAEDRLYVVMEYLEGGPVLADGCAHAQKSICIPCCVL
jgi:hypothetical protein